jgi:hypothetical protein
MAINNRTVTIKNVFASNAETTIPNPPVSGQSYRNTNLTAEEVGNGWPFKEIVDSAKFNEAMYEYTTICQQLEKYGFLPWSANTDYPAGGCALGSNGIVYQAKVNTGPGTTAVDPVMDTSHNTWDQFYYPTMTANKALISNANGKVATSSVTATELGYVHGVTSAIQTQLNNKAANNAVVHIAGAETITGAKTFENQLNVRMSSDAFGYRVQNTSVARGTTPDNTVNYQWVAQGNDGLDINHRLGGMYVYYRADGVYTDLVAYKPEAYNETTNPNINSIIRIAYPKNGSPYTYAPNPSLPSNASGYAGQIVTVGYLEGNSGVVHKTGNETIGGTKTFSNTISGSINGNAATVTNGVYTTGNQTISGTKTFSSTIHGSINGNAATVTNGVYTTGNQTIGGTKTFSNTISGNINGNAATVTNGVYTTGNQTINGEKTFNDRPNFKKYIYSWTTEVNSGIAAQKANVTKEPHQMMIIIIGFFYNLKTV